MLKKIKEALIELKINEISNLVNCAINSKSSPIDILNMLREGMEEVGRKYEDGEYFLSELIMAGETIKEAFKILGPKIEVNKMHQRVKIVLGTIRGDLHDIGKDIVATLLISMGFEVCDLGIDVSPSQFAKIAKEIDAKIVGVSALLSTTVISLAEVDKALKKVGIRDKVKLIAGGAAVRKDASIKMGLDAAVNDAMEGINIIKSWIRDDDL